MTAEVIGDGAWVADSGRPGKRMCLSFGVHGNERPPIEAGKRLLDELQSGELAPAAGALLLLYANPKASEENRRWSADGVDLNRCFHPSVLGRAPALYEERRAREIVDILEDFSSSILVDFHCTVEPGRRFLMHHPPISDPAHAAVTRFLEAEVVLADPALRFGGVSLDEWMSMRKQVGICYETGWIGDPANTSESVYAEMKNVISGCGLLNGRRAASHPDKHRLELFSVVTCEGTGFTWVPGIGENLQSLSAGTSLGCYADGREVAIGEDATLIFPKKKPELVQNGKPLVFLARRVGA